MRRLLILCLLLSAALHLRAAESTPESAIRTYFNALQRDGLIATADFMHPEELQRFKTMMLPMFKSSSAIRSLDLNRRFFGSTATVDTAAATSPRDFMRAFLRMGSNMGAAANIKFQPPTIIGSVQEGDTVHFITRNTAGAGDLSITQLEITSLRKDGEHWRLLLSGSMEGMAQGQDPRALGR
jgi:hypothetical protein